MPIETERKFLVDRDKWETWKAENETVDGIRDIEQGYLSMDPNCSIRVRIESWPSDLKFLKDGRMHNASVDIKGKLEGASRKEISLDAHINHARELMEMCGIFTLKKKRYWYKHKGLIWEIDEFENGLLLAEFEMTPYNERHLPEDGSIDIPSFVGKEVTDDPAYYNVNLVRSCP